jgi:hypothetical protein
MRSDRGAPVDVTVIATAAITGSVGLTAAALQARMARLQVQTEARRTILDGVERRRRERQDLYESTLDLLTAFTWGAGDGTSGDVLTSFTTPFVRAATRIRVYGSPAAVAAVDVIQAGLVPLNSADGDDDAVRAGQADLIRGIDALFDAARSDVGPRPEDGLPNRPFLTGGGPLVYDRPPPA